MSGVRLSVSGTRFATDKDVLDHDALKAQELAPAVTLPDYNAPEIQAPVDLAPPRQSPPIATTPDVTATGPKFDLRAAYDDARQRANENALAANLYLAGSQAIKGATGVDGSKMYDALKAGAEAPHQQFQDRMSVESALEKMRKAADAENPASRANRMAQERFRLANPTLARAIGDDNIYKSTAAELQKALENHLSGAKLEELTNYHKALDQNADLQRAMLASQFGPKLNIEQQKADAAMISAKKMPFAYSAAAQDQRDRQQQHFESKALEDYDKRVEKFRPAYTEFAELERLAPGLIKGKVPANIEFGPAEQMKRRLGESFGSNFSTAENEQINGIYQKLVNDERFITAGANLTSMEVNNFRQIMQNGLLADPGVKAAMLDSLRRTLRTKLATAKAAFYPAIGQQGWDNYIGMEGMGPDSNIFSDLQPAQPQRQQAAPSGAQEPALPEKPPFPGAVLIRRVKDKKKTWMKPERAALYSKSQDYEVLSGK